MSRREEPGQESETVIRIGSENPRYQRIEAILDRFDGTVPDSELEKVKTAVFINEINRQGF